MAGLSAIEGRGEQRNVRDAYGVALAALAMSTFMIIASGSPVLSPVAVVAGVLQMIALTVTLRVSGVRRQWRHSLLAVVLVVFAVGLAGGLFGGDAGTLVAQSGWLLLTVSTIVAIMRRLATYSHVTLQLVLGLLCIYLLIGLSFGMAYLLVETVRPGAFGDATVGASGCVYFSFITLATVGYGDITPVNSLARAIAVIEAVLGQLYLVSVVSLAVSRLGFKSKRMQELEETP